MNIDEFAGFYNISPQEREFIVKYGFEKTANSLTVVPETLQDEYILAQLGKLRRPVDAHLILAAAAELKSDKYLLSLYNYLIYYWWHDPDAVIYGHKLPEFESAQVTAERAGLYYLLVVLAGFPEIEKSYAKLGLPDHYALDAIQYTSGAIDEFAAGHNGAVGHSKRKLHWYRFYLNGVLFRLGRLEFMIQDPLPYLPAAYKRKADGKVIALARHGWKFSCDGLQLFTDDSDDKIYRKAVICNDGKTISGIPLNPAGYAETDRTITLDLDEYTPLWSSWDLVPGLHIPGGGGMTPEAVEDSLRQAWDFFPSYFKRKVAAVSCYSWIFNPDLEQELPESNLAKFMQQVYLFPVTSVGVEGLQFVFGRSDQD
ncbi:MAG: hypothetical protein J6S19_07650, partial [Lentisphaeria bacterium]|nr:hypothetical protein [Lentisphaeria bacterium]